VKHKVQCLNYYTNSSLLLLSVIPCFHSLWFHSGQYYSGLNYTGTWREFSFCYENCIILINYAHKWVLIWTRLYFSLIFLTSRVVRNFLAKVHFVIYGNIQIRCQKKKNPGGGEIFRTRPDRPWDPPNLLYNGYRVFLGGKTAGAWCWPPISF
jgi:hypothetical protein